MCRREVSGRTVARRARAGLYYVAFIELFDRGPGREHPPPSGDVNRGTINQSAWSSCFQLQLVAARAGSEVTPHAGVKTTNPTRELGRWTLLAFGPFGPILLPPAPAASHCCRQCSTSLPRRLLSARPGCADPTPALMACHHNKSNSFHIVLRTCDVDERIDRSDGSTAMQWFRPCLPTTAPTAKVLRRVLTFSTRAFSTIKLKAGCSSALCFTICRAK